MYQAVCDMLSDASRREIVLRAELVVAREENARLNAELVNASADVARGPHEQADAVVFGFGREAV